MAKKSELGEEVTDVLAAEEFAVPAPDPALRPEQLDLPADLVGGEPRDVLAAEEFAMPAPDEAHLPPGDTPANRPPVLKLIAVNLSPLLLAVWLQRYLRHRRRNAA